MSDLLFSAQVYFMIGLFIFIIKRKSWVAVAFYILILFTALHVRNCNAEIPFLANNMVFIAKNHFLKSVCEL